MTATELTILISAAAVAVSALAIAAGLKGVRDQLRVTVFLTYTDRYARIMNGIPFAARQPGSDYRLAHRPDDERIRVLSAFREYFNLCSEEKWLHDHRKLDRSTWHVWVRTMRVVAQFPCFGEAWEALGFEYDGYADFQGFVVSTLLPYTDQADRGKRAAPAVGETVTAETPDPSSWAAQPGPGPGTG